MIDLLISCSGFHPLKQQPPVFLFVCLFVFFFVCLFVIIMINLIYIAQLDTNGILTALYIVIKVHTNATYARTDMFVNSS